jgi:uncharacterized protein (DUF2147 family)
MRHLVISILLIASQFSFQKAASSDKIVGVWLNEEKSNKIEIYKVSDTYSGKIVWIEQLESNSELDPKDKNNPNPKMRSRSILGMDIITGLKYSNGKWENGTLYIPQKGIYAPCTVELHADSKLSLVVSKGRFSRTKTWIRE